MPIYEFKCECKYVTEIREEISRKPASVPCQHCGKDAYPVFSNFNTDRVGEDLCNHPGFYVQVEEGRLEKPCRFAKDEEEKTCNVPAIRVGLRSKAELN